MATHYVLMSGNLLPHDGNSFIAPYSVEDSTTQDMMVGHMSGTADSAFKGIVLIPNDYVGTPVLEIWWTSITTGSAVFFEIRHRVMTVDSSELDVDTTPNDIIQSVTTSGDPGAAAEVTLASISLTTTDFGAAKLLYFELYRQASTEAGDTLTDPVTLISLFLKYNTT